MKKPIQNLTRVKGTAFPHPSRNKSILGAERLQTETFGSTARLCRQLELSLWLLKATHHTEKKKRETDLEGSLRVWTRLVRLYASSQYLCRNSSVS